MLISLTNLLFLGQTERLKTAILVLVDELNTLSLNI